MHTREEKVAAFGRLLDIMDLYFRHPLMRRIVELREKGFADKDLYPEAPVDYEDCIENYKRILDMNNGLVCGEPASTVSGINNFVLNFGDGEGNVGVGLGKSKRRASTPSCACRPPRCVAFS